MEQMKPNGLETVEINFDDPSLPERVRTLRPLVWHDEASFCVLLGPDPQAGVFGCGDTIRAALTDWDQHVSDLQFRELIGAVGTAIKTSATEEIRSNGEIINEPDDVEERAAG